MSHFTYSTAAETTDLIYSHAILSHSPIAFQAVFQAHRRSIPTEFFMKVFISVRSVLIICPIAVNTARMTVLNQSHIFDQEPERIPSKMVMSPPIAVIPSLKIIFILSIQNLQSIWIYSQKTRIDSRIYHPWVSHSVLTVVMRLFHASRIPPVFCSNPT